MAIDSYIFQDNQMTIFPCFIYSKTNIELPEKNSVPPWCKRDPQGKNTSDFLRIKKSFKYPHAPVLS